MKTFLKTAEECVGKIVHSTNVYRLSLGPGSGSFRVLRRRGDISDGFGKDVLEVESLEEPGCVYHILFEPGELWTEVPEYIEKWSERL